MCARLS